MWFQNNDKIKQSNSVLFIIDFLVPRATKLIREAKTAKTKNETNFDKQIHFVDCIASEKLVDKVFSNLHIF